jgi:hypothetical protein
MNDCCFDLSLEREQPTVDSLTINCSTELNEPDDKGNLGTALDKAISLVIRILHDIHSLHNLRIKNEMKADSTWELNDKNCIASSKPEMFFFCSPNHGVQHARKHRVLEEKEHNTVEQVFGQHACGQ